MKLSEEVLSKESVISIDKGIVDWIYTFRTSFLTDFMIFITSLADVRVISGILFVLIIISVFMRKKKYLIPLVLTLLTNYVFVEIVKTLFSRQRPLLENALIVENSFSYPSGHALIAITFYGLLIIYLQKTLKTTYKKVIVVLLGVILILAVGLSRIYLGVHWPSDVLASYLIGICWLCLVMLCIFNKDYFVNLYRKYVLNK